MILYFLLMLMTACPEAPKSDVKAIEPKKDKTPEASLFSMDKSKPMALPMDKKVEPILGPNSKLHEIPPMMPSSSSHIKSSLKKSGHGAKTKHGAKPKKSHKPVKAHKGKSTGKSAKHAKSKKKHHK